MSTNESYRANLNNIFDCNNQRCIKNPTKELFVEKLHIRVVIVLTIHL